MGYKPKIFVIVFGSILTFLFFIMITNEAYYIKFKYNLMVYGHNAVSVLQEGTDRGKYIDHIKSSLEKKGLKNITVEISGEEIYGATNTLYIEVTPPSTDLDTMLHRDIKPITVKSNFINMG